MYLRNPPYVQLMRLPYQVLRTSYPLQPQHIR